MTEALKNNDLFSIYDNYLKDYNNSVNDILVSAVNETKRLEKNMLQHIIFLMISIMKIILILKMI